MRIIVSLLLLSACAAAQLKLRPQDESEIRTAIEEQAKKDNQKNSGQVWSERGPLVYRVGAIEPLAADVATAEAEGVRTGTFSDHRQYLFILVRGSGHWTIARKTPVCNGPAPVRIQPLSASRQFAARGSSGCLN
jgi:hypothetical protein